MICFKCDRCGEVFDGYKVDGFNGIAKIKTGKNGANIIAGEEPIQLCPSCMKELNDWLEPNKEKLDNGNNCCSVWWVAWKLDNIETKMKR